jgi:hypothetical protein
MPTLNPIPDLAALAYRLSEPGIVQGLPARDRALAAGYVVLLLDALLGEGKCGGWIDCWGNLYE